MEKKGIRYYFKPTPVTIFVTFLLSLLCVIVNIIGCIATASNVASLVINIVDIILGILVLLYLIVLYKVPHGNGLRYVFLTYAVVLGVALAFNSSNVVTVCVSLAMIIGISFVAGRLNKRTQNRWILIGVLALAIVRSCTILDLVSEIVGGGVTFTSVLMSFDSVVFLLSLGFSYVLRYDQHTNAGIEADKKVEKTE